MRRMTAQEQMDRFDEDDWGTLSDSVMNSGGQALERPALRRLYAALPEDIRDNVMHWGMSDTPTRDSIFEFLERNPTIRDAAANETEPTEQQVEQAHPAADLVAWVAPHQNSEDYARLGHASLMVGRPDDAKAFFYQAATAEEAALEQLDDSQCRIFGALANRVVNLWRLAGDRQRALVTAHFCLVNLGLLDTDRARLDATVMDIYLGRQAKLESVLSPSSAAAAGNREQTQTGDSLVAVVDLVDSELIGLAEMNALGQSFQASDPLTMELGRRLASANERISELELNLQELREMVGGNGN